MKLVNIFDMPCGASGSANTADPSSPRKRDVDVAAVAFALIVFRHERQGFAVLVGDLLGAVLVDGVVVAGHQRVVVAEPDLLLAQVAFALDALAVHAGALHAQPDVAQQRFHPGGRQHRVVDVVVAGRGQPAVTGPPGVPVGVVEDHELEFGCDESPPAPCSASRSSCARRMPRGAGYHGSPAVPGQVGHHQRGARQPRQQPQAWRSPASSPCRRSRSPSCSWRSRRRCSCPRRRPTGSCNIPRRARRRPRRTAARRSVCR